MSLPHPAPGNCSLELLTMTVPDLASAQAAWQAVGLQLLAQAPCPRRLALALGSAALQDCPMLGIGRDGRLALRLIEASCALPAPADGSGWTAVGLHLPALHATAMPESAGWMALPDGLWRAPGGLLVRPSAAADGGLLQALWLRSPAPARSAAFLAGLGAGQLDGAESTLWLSQGQRIEVHSAAAPGGLAAVACVPRLRRAAARGGAVPGPGAESQLIQCGRMLAGWEGAGIELL